MFTSEVNINNSGEIYRFWHTNRA